jgi:ParB-like chromosome segregation protein Spo0J
MPKRQSNLGNPGIKAAEKVRSSADRIRENGPSRKKEAINVAKHSGDSVRTSSHMKSPTATGIDDAYQEHVESLNDRLLLSIRDGAWRKVSDLASWLAPRVNVELAVHRYMASGGTHEKKLDHKSGEGQKLILKDILDSLRSKRLLALRASETGEEEAQSTPLADDRFEIDPEFENLLPRAPDEVKKLEERLLVEEPRDPLVVWKGHGKLVDGHTRFRLLSLLGRNYPVVEMEFADREAVKMWLRATHYGRRSYSQEMKAYIRGTDYLARKKKHGGARKKTSGQRVHLKTADAVAAEYGVEGRTVRRDGVFAGALDRIADACGAEVRQKVLSRVATWTRRDVERLARLDKSVIQEIVREALAAGKRPKIPSPTKDTRPIRKSVSIPMGKPVEQVRVLRKVLGGKGLARLQAAISRFFEKQKGSRPS